MANSSQDQKFTVQHSFKRTLDTLENNFKGEDGFDYNRPTLYLSGPMSGMPEHNQPEFTKWAEHFRNKGFFVFNPAENFQGRTGLGYATHFLEDVIQVLFCTHIFMLPEWRRSKGAYCEYLLARRLDLIFVDETGLRIDPPYANEIADLWHFNKEILNNPVDVRKDLCEITTKKLCEDIDNKFMNNIAEDLVKEDTTTQVSDIPTVPNNAWTEALRAQIRQREQAEKDLVDFKIINHKLREEIEQLKKANLPPEESTESLAIQAERIVNGDRRSDYNHPYYNFKQTAELWTALGFSFQGKPVGAEHIADAMILVKLSREAHKHKKDNNLDIIGYVLCDELTLQKQKEIEASLASAADEELIEEYERIDD